MNKRIAMLFAASLLTLTACGANNNVKDSKDSKNNTKMEQKVDSNNGKKDTDKSKKNQDVSISDWQGTWNDMSAYLDNQDLQSAYAEVAKRDNKKPEEVKRELKNRRKNEFGGIVIQGNKVTFLDKFKDKGGKEVFSSEYKFIKSFETKHGNETLEWDQFEATDKNAKYPIIIMMPIHGEESLTHFHMRYGKNIDELLKQDKWFPTYVKPSTTSQQLIDEIKE
ncbi:ZinT/AdcA family metal-binding protein [Peptostreptococcus equinus]|uniref:ZinT/AdcA family metal-binding protein n=1 Tax=Peptostreptococcus equinus TaxID=3003601 RepID=A0ABY7JQA2_9FIRM|nr:ZinT/AdcA family metal-binding protein [Peptostreptococcus sp. CBA3647]WAW15535.1 ZinT/AdcA family metal-binding protein [Peptostreptococcus sp. CBA3647]